MPHPSEMTLKIVEEILSDNQVLSIDEFRILLSSSKQYEKGICLQCFDGIPMTMDYNFFIDNRWTVVGILNLLDFTNKHLGRLIALLQVKYPNFYRTIKNGG